MNNFRMCMINLDLHPIQLHSIVTSLAIIMIDSMLTAVSTCHYLLTKFYLSTTSAFLAAC